MCTSYTRYKLHFHAENYIIGSTQKWAIAIKNTSVAQFIISLWFPFDTFGIIL